MPKPSCEKIPAAMLGEILVRQGLINDEMLEQALVEQQSSHKKLGKILVEKNLITPNQLKEILREQHVRLGEILLEEKIISNFELEQSLIEQRRYQKPLGQILLDRSLVSSEQLARILQKQYWQKNGFWVIGKRILTRRSQLSFS